MSVAPSPDPEAKAAPDGVCTQCGAPLADDQEWCLECGGARTLIHRPPDWRVAIAIIGVIAAVALAAFVVALVNLSSDANQRAALAAASTPAPVITPTTPPATTTPSATTPTTASTPTTGTTATTATTGTTATTATTSTTATTATTPTTPIASTATTVTTPSGVRLEAWPAGLSGWTVVLSSSRSQAAALTTAEQLVSSGIQVGVLDSSQHPRLAPGFWLVFTGRYPTKAQADLVVSALLGLGHPGAVPRLVGRPGDVPG
jgi:septal ring-binding cell division protein DamX